MTTPATIAAALTQAALNPKAVSTDKGKVESHSLPDLIAALEYQAAQTAVAKNHFGLSIVRLDFPGAG